MRIVALLVALLLAVPARAQDEAPPGLSEAPFVIKRDGATMLAGRLSEAELIDPAGKVLGDVEGIILTRDGRIRALIVGLGGVLGMGERDVAIDYTALSVRDTDDGVAFVTTLSKAELDAAPAYLERGR